MLQCIPVYSVCISMYSGGIHVFQFCWYSVCIVYVFRSRVYSDVFRRILDVFRCILKVKRNTSGKQPEYIRDTCIPCRITIHTGYVRNTRTTHVFRSMPLRQVQDELNTLKYNRNTYGIHVSHSYLFLPDSYCAIYIAIRSGIHQDTSGYVYSLCMPQIQGKFMMEYMRNT